MMVGMDEMSQLIVDFHLSSVIFTNNPTKTSLQDLVSSVYLPPRRKGRLKRPRNYNVMRRIRLIADQAKAGKMETSYALKRYSSKTASILGPPFVKNKVKRRKRRNDRRFQKKKRRQERKPIWESELEFNPSQPLMFETFIERFLTFDPRKVNQQLCTVNTLTFPSRKRKKNRRLHIGTRTGKKLKTKSADSSLSPHWTRRLFHSVSLSSQEQS
jgi:hypothetical protein